MLIILSDVICKAHRQNYSTRSEVNVFLFLSWGFLRAQVSYLLIEPDVWQSVSVYIQVCKHKQSQDLVDDKIKTHIVWDQ